jgi:hypothetical protein
MLVVAATWVAGWRCCNQPTLALINISHRVL